MKSTSQMLKVCPDLTILNWMNGLARQIWAVVGKVRVTIIACKRIKHVVVG